jgi:hypothetical protein
MWETARDTADRSGNLLCPKTNPALTKRIARCVGNAIAPRNRALGGFHRETERRGIRDDR